ncbi:MAG: class I SAM-dependent methyltransferase [Polyangiaceae bacterium]
MAEAVDYFTNHRLKIRFPWSLYHRPIIDALRATLETRPGTDVLNLGSGPFLELPELGRLDHRFTLADIDPRAISLARELHGSALVDAKVIEADKPLPFADAQFDVVVSMDVIEHVPDPLPWLKDAVRVLRPGGTLFLTTPNYASLSLRVLEATALEAVARLQGFSRANLHPSKMTPARLRGLFAETSCANPSIDTIALGWVLAVSARKA